MNPSTKSFVAISIAAIVSVHPIMASTPLPPPIPDGDMIPAVHAAGFKGCDSAIKWSLQDFVWQSEHAHFEVHSLLPESVQITASFASNAGSGVETHVFLRQGATCYEYTTTSGRWTHPCRDMRKQSRLIVFDGGALIWGKQNVSSPQNLIEWHDDAKSCHYASSSHAAHKADSE